MVVIKALENTTKKSLKKPEITRNNHKIKQRLLQGKKLQIKETLTHFFSFFLPHKIRACVKHWL